MQLFLKPNKNIHIMFDGADISLILVLEIQRGWINLRCVRFIHCIWKQVVLGQTLQLFSRFHSHGVRMLPYAVEKKGRIPKLLFCRSYDKQAAYSTV